MDEAYTRNWRNRVRRRSREFRGRLAAKFSCARRIPVKFFRWARSMNRKEALNRNRLTRSCFRSGDELSGGVHLPRASKQKERARTLGWHFLCAAETRKTPAKSRRDGSGHTPVRELPWKRRLRGLYSGKR